MASQPHRVRPLEPLHSPVQRVRRIEPLVDLPALLARVERPVARDTAVVRLANYELHQHVDQLCLQPALLGKPLPV